MDFLQQQLINEANQQYKKEQEEKRKARNKRKAKRRSLKGKK